MRTKTNQPTADVNSTCQNSLLGECPASNALRVVSTTILLAFAETQTEATQIPHNIGRAPIHTLVSFLFLLSSPYP